MERSNFPHRNLGEDDEELLNGIWAGLEMPDDRPDADGRDFDDVKRDLLVKTGAETPQKQENATL